MNDDTVAEREAGSVSLEANDAAVRDTTPAAASDAGLGAFADAATPDAASTSGAAVVSRDAAVSAQPAASAGFMLTSPAFTHGARLPAAFTCEGADKSPPLDWSNPPEGARSFALMLTATRTAFARKDLEWVVWNIPADSRALPEGMAAGRDPSNGAGVRQEGLSDLERAALDLGVPGRVGAVSLGPAALAPVALPSPFDLVRRPRYRGPCDEQGVSYEFTLFALDELVSIERELFVSLEAVEQWMKTAPGALGRASIVATYP